MADAIRLPSFNDFSPGILRNDLRQCLAVVKASGGKNSEIHKEFAKLYFGGALNKRSTTNIPATLRSTGLVTDAPELRLSAFGEEVLASSDARSAIRTFCAGILKEQNGTKLLDALSALAARRERVTKDSLKAELRRHGVTKLATGTTDHTTLLNWMVAGGIVELENGIPRVDDAVVKSLLGISVKERDAFDKLDAAQQVFLQLLRRRREVEAGPFSVGELLENCLKTHPHLFDEDQFAKKVRKPLVDGEWIEIDGLGTGKQGGKSGRVQGTKKLIDIPIEQLLPDLDSAIPRDLRSKINVPLAEILADLRGADTYKAGLALELLAVRMIWDLDLQPRGFRLRSKESAYAEVDVVAEGAHLLFSRWTMQCKRMSGKTHVGLGEVAKEVGIAIYTHSHVVVMVTTTDFSREAYQYAEQITKQTFLQFLFVPGKVVDKYLKEGRSALWNHVLKNAVHVMQQKRAQPLAPTDGALSAITTAAGKKR
jgi:hypothetical protein